MRITLAQINTTVHDLQGNLAAIVRACERARAAGIALVLTPEMALLGYPPQDLVERPDVLQACSHLMPALAEASRGLVLVAGTALPDDGAIDGCGRGGRPAINAAVIFEDGRHVATVAKRLLPTYDVFDEDRYFRAGDRAQVLELLGRKVGVTICEDIWSEDEHGPRRYAVDPVGELVAAGADCILNLSASPFDLGKAQRRHALVAEAARRHGVPIAYCNLVGGNDQLLFDGRSFALGPRGETLAVGRGFETDDIDVTLPAAIGVVTGRDTAPLPAAPDAFCPSPADEARDALVMGVRDYVHKCGFSDVLIGLSGGIDSALTAAIAVRALGPEHVTGVGMPGPYSSDGSVKDALDLAENLGIRCPIIPIAPVYDGVCEATRAERQRPGNDPGGVTDQNFQARARALVLMGLSNHTGTLVLTTGNKSELAVGYCTLYGDMAGGLAVIGDLPKMLVYEVARSCNQERVVIPESTLTKPPSAELAPNQTDQDSLPPYPVLDAILDGHVVDRRDATEIAARTGYPLALVRRIVRMVEANEYKRRQAAPALRVTRKAFGGGRRMPIARRLPPR